MTSPTDPPGRGPRWQMEEQAGVTAGTDYRRPSRLLVFSVTAMALLNNAVLMSSTPEILADLGQPVERAGMLIAAGTLAGIVAAPAIGFLADRYGRKRILVPCLLVFGAFGCLGGFSPSFEVLLTVRILQGLGSAGLINLVMVLISDHWSGLDRARLLGQNSAVITGFLAVFPFLGGATTDLFGWRWNFAYYGLSLLAGAAVARYLHDPWSPRRDPVGRQVRDALTEVRVPLTATCMALGTLIFFVMFGVFLTLVPIHLAEKFGLGPTARGVVAAVPAVTSTMTSLAVIWFRRRFSVATMVVAGLAVFAASFVAMGLGTLWLLVVATGIYGLAEGITLPTITDQVAERAPEHLRGVLMALWVGGLRIGQTTGPLAVGVAMGWWSTATVFVVAGGGVAAIAVMLVVSRVLPSTPSSA
ncbi:MAG: MFS transporter [Actinomycetota bacterium]|nr:MFS transporter [Actinomycetota bacterium]